MRSYVKGMGAGARRCPGCVESGQLMPSDSPAVHVVISVGPARRLMRGHIAGPACRCLSGIGRSLQAYCASRGVALIYFMAQSSGDRALEEQRHSRRGCGMHRSEFGDGIRTRTQCFPWLLDSIGVFKASDSTDSSTPNSLRCTLRWGAGHRAVNVRRTGRFQPSPWRLLAALPVCR